MKPIDDALIHTKLLRWCVVLGLVLRCWHYFRCPSVWMDEGAMLSNVINLDYHGHLGPLLLDQATPPLYLMLLRFLSTVFNDGILVVRSVSFVSSCCALLLVSSLARHLLVPLAATIAVLLFAVSDSLLFHACEAKPYSSDVCLAAFVGWLFFRIRNWSMTYQFLLAAFLAPWMIWFSFPACFVLGGCLVAQLPRFVQRGTSVGSRAAYLFFASTVAVSFYLLFIGPIRAQSTDELRLYWVDGFTNWSKPIEVPLWSILQAGEVARYVSPPWGNAFVLFAVWGAIYWFRKQKDQRMMLYLLVMPVVAAWVASLLGRYPFMAARVMAFAAPAIVLLAGAGIADILPRIWARKLFRFWAVVIVLYVMIPLGYSVYVAIVPWYRPASDQVTEYLFTQRQPEEAILYNHWDYEYYLRKLPMEQRKLSTDANTPEWISKQKVMWLIYVNSVRPTQCPFELPEGFEVTHIAEFRMTTVYHAVRR